MLANIGGWTSVGLITALWLHHMVSMCLQFSGGTQIILMITLAVIKAITD